MKEKRDAQQAYKSAMQKMKMPALLDTEQHMISSGSGGIKMKSKALAFAAAAAVLALFIGVGAFMLSRNADDNIKIGSSKDMTLEADDTIPSGEITSVAQAVSEHQKCELLENDEYIKLKAGKDNITKQMADSFFERTGKISERNEKCLNYISDNSEDKTLFVHAIKYDNGYIDLKFHLDSESWKKFDELYEKGYSYYICKADTGEKLLRCVTKYSDSPKDILVSTDTSQSAADLEKLTGKLSYVMIGSDEYNEKEIVLKEFEFFDKTFISGTERSELEQLAEKARDSKNSTENNISENCLNITADKVVCSQHGMYMRLTVTAANDTGKSIIKKSLTSEHGENTVRLSGGDQADAPQPDVNLGKSVTTVGWYTTLVGSTENKLVYDCYLPMTRSVDMDLNFVVYAVMQDPTLTADEIAEGIGRNKKLGSIKVKYEKPMQEREFVCGDKKILLSDLCLGISNVTDDVTEITLKKADGSQEKLTEQDFEQRCIVKYGDESSGDDFEPKHKSFTQIAAPEDFRANFITKQVDTSKVTSIVYAGEEYKLAQSEENTQTQSSEYKTLADAQEAFSKAYDAQLNILEKYKNDKDKLTENDIKELCNESVSELDIMGKAGAAIGKYEQGTLLARRTTANELIVYMWNDYNIGFASGSTVNGICDIIDPNGKETAHGELQLDYIKPPTNASYNRYMLITIACKGYDLSALVHGSEKNYKLAIHDNAGGVKNFEFGLAYDGTEMSIEERTLLDYDLAQAAHYGEFKTQK